METQDMFFDELKFDNPTSGEFTGVAVTFDRAIPHYVFGSDVVKPHAFSRSLAARGPRAVKMLWQHSTSSPIGVWTAIQEKPSGLFVTGQLLLEVQQAREAHALMKSGAIGGLSVGFSIPDGGASVDARTRTRTIREGDLMEISLVTFPADVHAQITEIKSAQATFAAMVEEIRRARRLLRSGR